MRPEQGAVPATALQGQLRWEGMTQRGPQFSVLLCDFYNLKTQS